MLVVPVIRGVLNKDTGELEFYEMTPDEILESENRMLRAFRQQLSTLLKEKWVRIMCDHSADPFGRRTAEDLTSPTFRCRAPFASAYGSAWYGLCPWDGSEWPDIDALSTEGEAIARAVKSELPDWTVIYYHEAKAEAFFRGRQRPADFDEYGRTYFEYEVHGALKPVSKPGQRA